MKANYSNTSKLHRYVYTLGCTCSIEFYFDKNALHVKDNKNVCTYICMYLYTYVLIMYVPIYVCTYIRMYLLCMYLYMYVHLYVCA